MIKCYDCKYFENKILNKKLTLCCLNKGQMYVLKDTSLDVPEWCDSFEAKNTIEEKPNYQGTNGTPFVIELKENYFGNNDFLNNVSFLTKQLNKTVNDMDNELGSRFNEGKLRWSLLDLSTLEGLVKVLMMGAEKYSDYNWQKGLPITEVYESLMRHMVAYMNGEDNDTESGLSHLDHALCNLYFMKWFMDNKPEMDNRRKKKTVIPEQDFLEHKYPNENEK